MKIKILFTILILKAQIGFGQRKHHDSKIINELLSSILDEGDFYISCSKSKTYLDSSGLDKEMGVELTAGLINELIDSSKKSKDGQWMKKDLLNYKDLYTCHSTLEQKSAFIEKNRLISLSDPVYDLNYSFCIVSIVFTENVKSSYGYHCLLKREGDNWHIVETFDVWIS